MQIYGIGFWLRMMKELNYWLIRILLNAKTQRFYLLMLNKLRSQTCLPAGALHTAKKFGCGYILLNELHMDFNNIRIVLKFYSLNLYFAREAIFSTSRSMSIWAMIREENCWSLLSASFDFNFSSEISTR